MSESESNKKTLKAHNLVVCFLDWLEVHEHCFLVSIGLNPSGDMCLLHHNEGPLNDFSTAHQHLESLRNMGFEPPKPILFVINGATCLRNIVPGVLGENVVLQRCQLRCSQELADSLPDDEGEEFGNHLQGFFEMTYNSSRIHVQDFSSQVMANFPTVAANLLENSEETMTVNRMEIPMPLKLTLVTTSMIWQHPPSFSKRLEKALLHGKNPLKAIQPVLEKRFRDLSPVAGFKDLWLLEPALKEELKASNPVLQDFRELLSSESEHPDQVIDPKARRRNKRWEVEGIQGFVQHTIETEILNIGMTGLAVETHMPLAIGGKHSIRLQHSEGEVTLLGTVAWSRLTPSQDKKTGHSELVYHTGIEFESTLSAEGKEARFFFDKIAKIDVNRRVFGRFHYEEGSSEGTQVEMGALVPFRVLKVSFSGMLIETDTPPEDDIINMEIQVFDKKLEVSGRVANVEEVEDTQKHLVGIEFLGLNVDDKQILATLLEKVMKD